MARAADPDTQAQVGPYVEVTNDLLLVVRTADNPLAGPRNSVVIDADA